MRAPLQLSRLRDIGWDLWDPIGLRTLERGWQGSAAADEYDSYLLNVAGQIRRSVTQAECIAYLVHIEVEHMGCAESSTTVQRATETVAAITRYLAELPLD